MIRRLALLVPLLLAGCAATPKLAPPRPAPKLPVVTPPAPRPLDWTDAPLTEGSWHYLPAATGSSASFGAADQPAAVQIRCDLAQRQIALSVRGSGTTLSLTTSYAMRALPAGAGADGRVTALIGARDLLLDQLAFTRARFAVQAAAGARAIVPIGGELVRVIEDCRA